MKIELDRIDAAIQALDAQRAVLGDAIVDTALAPLRARRADLLADAPAAAHAAAPATAPVAPAAPPTASAATTPATPATPERLLKQVTVVFLDVVGSTALSQHLDPEDIQHIMDGLLARCTAAVQRHHGKVLQYAGDSLLAAFGTEGSVEEDPERAVRAGLELLAEGRAQGALVLQQFGRAGFDVRVGIHTGSVLLGGGVDEDGTIRGITVNIAARMEQSAPVGALRISHDTYQHVRGVFDVQPQPPLQVKGHDAPILTYLVASAKPRAFRLARRGIEGLDTPMVGRAAELAQLLAALTAATTTQQVHAVTVIADAGLGKSRLIHEFQAALELDARAFWLLLGRADPAQRLQPYGLLRDLLAWRLQIADSDSAEVAKAKLVEGLAPRFGANAMGGVGGVSGVGGVGGQSGLSAETQARLIGQLIGFDFASHADLHGVTPRQLRDRAFAALSGYLRGLAASDGATVVMLLEDLQWADDGSLDFIKYLLATAEPRPLPLPLALVMTARPTLLERHADWGQVGGPERGEAQPQVGAARHTALTLTPLDASGSDALADALLRRIHAPPARLRELLIGQAGGNPFYMEELLRMLVDDGVIVVDGRAGVGAGEEANDAAQVALNALAGAATWRVLPDKLRDARVPTTLVGVLQARLDALSGPERHALQQASIVGAVFWDAAVTALDAPSGGEVAGLRAKALVVRHDSSAFEGTTEEAFKHHLLHQVTYDTVLKAVKREGHARAANWLAGRVGDRADEYLGVTAEHFERAGDAAKALDYFERAARAAKARFAIHEALAYLARAMALPELSAPLHRFRVLDIQAEAADWLGDRSLQEAALNEQTAIAEATGDDALRADNLSNRALLADRRGDQVSAAALAADAVRLAEQVGLAHVASVAHGELAWVNYCRGESDVALAHARESFRWGGLAARSVDPAPRQVHEIQACVMLSFIHQSRFEIDAARAALQHGLPLAQATGDLRMQAMVNESLGTMAASLGDLAQSELHHAEALVLTRQTGWRVGEATAVFNLGQCKLARGDVAAALASADQTFEMARRIEDASMMARSFILRADACVVAGDRPAALAAFEASRARFEALDAQPWVAISSSLMAEQCLAMGDLPRAQAEANRALDALASGVSLDGTGEEMRVRYLCFTVLHAAADERATPHIEALHADLQSKAARIADAATRHAMLENVDTHRGIVAAWAARQAAP